MSGLSSEFAEDRFNELLLECDGDYYRAEASYEIEAYGNEREGRRDEYGNLWSRIPGFSNYELSWNGDIISYIHKEPRRLKPWISKFGYPCVQIVGDNGIPIKRTIHSLVAEVFGYNPDPENYNVVRHMDDNPRNNSVFNLRYGTQAMNHQDMVDHGREFRKPVYCYELDREFYSGAAFAQEMGCSKSDVTNACKGKLYSCKGYHICYLEDKEEKLSNLEEWLYEPDPRKALIATCPDGSELHFASRKEAAEFFGIPDCGISSCINGSISHTHGIKFRNAR